MWLGVDRQVSSVPNDDGRRPTASVTSSCGEERGRRAVVVDAAGDAVLPAPPAVAEQRADDVVAGDEQVGDVEGLHLEPRCGTRSSPGVSSRSPTRLPLTNAS